MMTNSGDGFTDAELEEILREQTAATPDLEIRRNENDCLELVGKKGVLVTLCAAGREPYDYLLVDFADRPGWNDSVQVQILSDMAARLDLTILELESRLEYTPQQWFQIRGHHHGPDPERKQEAQRLALEKEIEFYERCSIPYTPEEVHLLESTIEHPQDSEIQQAARKLRDDKKVEQRVHNRTKERATVEPPPPPRWWPFGKRP